VELAANTPIAVMAVHPEAMMVVMAMPTAMPTAMHVIGLSTGCESRCRSKQAGSSQSCGDGFLEHFKILK